VGRAGRTDIKEGDRSHQSSVDEDHSHQSSADEDHSHQSGTDEDHSHQSSADGLDVRGVALRSAMTGKLCQHVMALIKWKRGVDPNVGKE
jgi:hypothetical protein